MAPVPEALLKKRKRAEKWEAETKANAAAAQTNGDAKKAKRCGREADGTFTITVLDEEAGDTDDSFTTDEGDE